MPTKSLPPYPKDNLRQWAVDLYGFLRKRGETEGEVLPRTIYLQHQLPNDRYVAVQKGLVMYDPSTGYPVVSTGTEWASIVGEGVDDTITNGRYHYNKLTKWLEEHIETTTNGSGVATVTFTKTFSNPPSVIPVVFDATNKYLVVLQAVSTTQATVLTFDTSGTVVTATVRLSVSGYWDGIS